MSNNLPWSHAIEHSFFYSEYVAYGIEKQADRITLQVWEKSYKDEAISEAIDAGRLYLKYEKRGQYKDHWLIRKVTKENNILV